MRRTLRWCLTAGLASAVMFTATNAQAIVVPLWPTGGRVPACDSVAPNGGGGSFNYDYTDSTPPRMSAVRFPGGKRVAVIGTGSTQLKFVSRVTDTCSGVGAVASAVQIQQLLSAPGATGVTLTYQPGKANYFDVKAVFATTFGRSGTGSYAFTLGGTQSRWTSFQLNSNFKLVGGTQVDASGIVWQQLDPRPLYVLSSTRSALSASATSVRSGRQVSLTAKTRVAGVTTWNLFSAKVTLQRQSGRKWVDVKTFTSGTSTKVTVNATTTYRVVVPRSLKVSNFYESSASKPITVRVG